MIPSEYVLIMVGLIALGVVLMILRLLAALVENERRWLALIQQARALRKEYTRKLAQLQQRGGQETAAEPAMVVDPVDEGEDGFDVDIVEEPAGETTAGEIGPADADTPARAAA